MPTVMRIEGLRVLIWPNDHRPAHVHVRGANSEAVFQLDCQTGPPTLRENFRFKAPDLARIEEALTRALAALCERWSIVHGDF